MPRRTVLARYAGGGLSLEHQTRGVAETVENGNGQIALPCALVVVLFTPPLDGYLILIRARAG